LSKRSEIEGKRWMKVADAARLLKTNAVGIRAMMGDGRLDWRQTRANSRTFVVDELAVLAMLKAKPLTVPPKPKIKDDRVSLGDGERRERGGLWIDHHLRLTVPHDGDAARKKKADPGSSPG
jgi:hypothetical protein